VTSTRLEHGTSGIDLSRAVWRKSTRSGGNGSCVEVAFLTAAVAVRDCKNPGGPKLIVTHDGWRTFIHDVKSGAQHL
jgi:Domain of unknown function (DUF397)